MDAYLLLLPAALLLLAVAALWHSRAELQHLRANLGARATARRTGSHQARLQHPDIDLGKCIGCGACVRACPEDGVLALAYGQAVVVHGARCVGHGRCAEACPTAAIALTLADLGARRDLPAVDAGLQAVGVPGLFLAGEITGFALVRTAVQHGAAVARAVAARLAAAPAGAAAPAAAADAAAAPLDLLVVGCGPAGLACLLAAGERRLRCLGLDQATALGGTVAAYPRQKLVMTQPMDLPGHGRLPRLEYSKEELVELWEGLARRHRLPIRTGQAVQGIARGADGVFTVTTTAGVHRARHVCLAVGRRGTPQRLSVPGEDLPKVAYALLDAHGYQGQRVLVVGGGDSAIEAALALAEQPGNEVVISYRRPAFTRLKARNEARLQAALADGRVTVRYRTVVESIHPDAVRLRPAEAAGDAVVLANDCVFVFAGGTPPFALLEAAGVSFDPADRPPAAAAVDRGLGLLVALQLTLLAVLGLYGFRWSHADYYDLPSALRPAAAAHAALRPQGPLGLVAGVGAVLLFAANLAYLLRRHGPTAAWLPGTLKSWMNLHVAAGLGAVLLALLHSGFLVRDSAGGHALLAMLVVVVAGVVGRWFYAFVPRAQNGRQQELEEVGAALAAQTAAWERAGRGLGADLRRQVEALVDGDHLGRGFLLRVFGLWRSQWRLRAALRQLARQARAAAVPRDEVAQLAALARQGHRLAFQLAHFEELRAVLSTWRWLHRWLALLLLLLTVVHVVTAVRYGGIEWPFGGQVVPR